MKHLFILIFFMFFSSCQLFFSFLDPIFESEMQHEVRITPSPNQIQAPTLTPTPALTPTPSPTPSSGYSYEYEAEDPGNIISGIAAVTTSATASGGQKVTNLGSDANNFVQFNINLPPGSDYRLTIYYSSAAPTNIYFNVDSSAPATIACQGTGGDDIIGSTMSNLVFSAGNYSLKFFNSINPAPDLDRIVFEEF